MSQKNTLQIALCAILVFLSSFSLFSQKNFISGEITSIDGTIIKGEINYQNWLKNPDQISFKENGSNEIKNIPQKKSKHFKLQMKNMLALM